MISKKVAELVAIAGLLCAMPSLSQEVHLVDVSPGFRWPVSLASAEKANSMPKGQVARLLHSALARILGSPPPGAPRMTVSAFRFVPLERGRFYLVLWGGERWTQTYVLVPEKGRISLADMQTIVGGTLPPSMSIVDFQGSGSDELITAGLPVGSPAALTPSIYWYTVWRFRDGVPEDVSAEFPEFYSQFVMPQVEYPQDLLRRLQARGANDVMIPLAEIAYIRLKYQRDVMGQENAGLKQALAWAQSKNADLSSLGIFSLADMSAPAAVEELRKLARVPWRHDLINALLARPTRAGRRIHRH